MKRLPFAAALALPFSCWIDLRCCFGPGPRREAEAALSLGEQSHLPRTYKISEDAILSGNEIIGKVVRGPPAILDAIRAGVYSVVLLESFDTGAASFALDRSRACARVSGIEVSVAVPVESVEQVDLIIDKTTKINSALILVIPANADEEVWAHAQKQQQQQENEA